MPLRRGSIGIVRGYLGAVPLARGYLGSSPVFGAEQSEIPDGVIGHADFLGGTYSAAGVPLSAAAVVDRPDRITPNGLEIPAFASDGIVHAIGGFLDVLLTANWTMRLDYEEIADFNNVVMLGMTGGVDGEDWDHQLQLWKSGDGAFQAWHEGPESTPRAATTANGVASLGVHRIGVTRTNDRIAMSVGGAAVISDENAVNDFVPTAAAFGGDPGFGDSSWAATRIHSCYLYEPMDDVALQALAA